MKLLILLFLVPTSSAFAQKEQSPTTRERLLKIEEKVSSLELKIEETKNVRSRHYEEILEKTNNQLSLWTNPYGLAVGVLSALLGLLAIGVTFLIYKQGSDHKRQIVEEKNERERQFKSLIDSWNEALKEQKTNVAKYDSLIATKVEEIKSTDASEKEVILKEIEEMKKDREKVTQDLGAIVSPTYSDTLSMLTGLSGPTFHRCSSCAYGYKIRSVPHALRSLYSGTPSVSCPKCGNVDQLN